MVCTAPLPKRSMKLVWSGAQVLTVELNNHTGAFLHVPCDEGSARLKGRTW